MLSVTHPVLNSTAHGLSYLILCQWGCWCDSDCVIIVTEVSGLPWCNYLELLVGVNGGWSAAALPPAFAAAQGTPGQSVPCSGSLPSCLLQARKRFCHAALLYPASSDSPLSCTFLVCRISLTHLKEGPCQPIPTQSRLSLLLPHGQLALCWHISHSHAATSLSSAGSHSACSQLQRWPRAHHLQPSIPGRCRAHKLLQQGGCGVVLPG